MNSGEFESFTKKEKRNISVEIEKLDTIYGGMKNLTNPKILIVVDPKKEETAVKEAKSLGLKIVALADTNTNPKNIDYLIPGNDDAIRSISMIVSALADSIERGRKSFHSDKK
ncbi:30S ribosomal protein S2 [bacterium]|nr:30S ribosomal protein S2 [bacterium]